MNKVIRYNETHESHKAHKFLLLLFLVLAAPLAQAQVSITIGGNVYGGGEHGKVNGNGNVTIKSGSIKGDVYGGGNLGDLDGHTTVTLQGGDFNGVFGGARMADIGKYTYVNVNGEHQLHDITANFVYGGNDISGQIGNNIDMENDVMPFTPEVNTTPQDTTVNNSFQSFIHTSKERVLTAEEIAALPSGTDDKLNIFIGQMFGGGNGAYDYVLDDDTGKYNVYRNSDKEETRTLVTTTASVLPVPELGKNYLQVNGGTFGYVFTGGNFATVNKKAVICINNESEVTHKTDDLDIAQYTPFASLTDPEIMAQDNPVDLRLMAMGINLSTFNNERLFLRVFGGNNKADMSIMPTWYLKKGSIHNLYSGGNQGDMTSKSGLLLEIMEDSEIDVINAFGGCRMANVQPKTADGQPTGVDNLSGYNFPSGLSARILVRGGTIQNVYGGNDITGNVYGGTAVGVYTSISGDVYGGGNGSYAYTDNEALKDDIIWGDFYYDPTKAATSVEALNAHRPNVEQISLRVSGKKVPDTSPGAADGDSLTINTIIGGSIYVGGNSATLLQANSANELVELKIGSYTIADNVFLGNNGVQMVDSTLSGPLVRYAGMVYNDDKTTIDFSSLDLTDANTFAKYMDGCAMMKKPRVVFDDTKNGDPTDYIPYSSYFGSFFCGGNVGSMTMPGKTTINFTLPVIIFDKLVGGCNTANVPEQTSSHILGTSGAVTGTVNAAYFGGIIGTEAERATEFKVNGVIQDVLEMNLSNLKIRPLRWTVKRDGSYRPILNAAGKPIYLDPEGNELADFNDHSHGQPYLEWNLISAEDGSDIPQAPAVSSGTQATAADMNRRLKGGNIYGGCYDSGRVIGNVIINLNASIIDKDVVFDEVQSGSDILYENIENNDFTIMTRHSGVIIDEQGMDPIGRALNVFGGGKGANTEIWGGTKINLNKGYTFQIFGGSEEGVIGKKGSTTYDPQYSTLINVDGTMTGQPSGVNDENMPDCEFIYGGAFEGPIQGNTRIYLGNGRVFNTFAGSCNADILGHTETYVGLNAAGNSGFPYVRDHIYGGNDLGGQILGEITSSASLADCDFSSRVTDFSRTKVYGYDADSNPTPGELTASAYIEYQKGRIDYIFGGCYGDYDYTDPRYNEYTYTTGAADATTENLGTARPGFIKPRMGNAFVNFRAVEESNSYNKVNKIFGAGQGHNGDSDRDIMQERSYILVDIPQTMEAFQNMEVFGGGAYSGLGMYKLSTTKADPDHYSAIVDLMRGQMKNAYGGSYDEGITRRSVVNVPAGSTISMISIEGDNNSGCLYGGAFGTSNTKPCDVYEAIVNYSSENANVAGAIYGGNNSYRRTLYGQVNINAPIWSNKSKGYNANVYGAGLGANTWSQYTEVNMNDGASTYKVYGGGNAGRVLNVATVNAWQTEVGAANLDLTLSNYVGDDYTDDGLANDLAHYSQLALDAEAGRVKTLNSDGNDVIAFDKVKYNTNVHFHPGSYLSGYTYGGGYGADAIVSGTAYVDVLGGEVFRDIYAGGESGAVYNKYNVKNDPADAAPFTSSATAYIRGGMVRNVYGGGYRGNVGYHKGITTSFPEGGYRISPEDVSDPDRLGNSYVIVGYLGGTDFQNGKPAIKRNAYAGGEGGSIYGVGNLLINNGFIGYHYKNTAAEGAPANYQYVEELDDATPGDNLLDEGGNGFGGGYVAHSYTDASNVIMFDGQVRGCLYGGGEIGPIGRGAMRSDYPTTGAWTHTTNEGDVAKIYKPGYTHVYLYGGKVLRDVFGGGRGFDNWNGDGTMYYGASEVSQMDLKAKGFVFGSTDVHIRGGEVGTEFGSDYGFGNVFGGGNVGYVFSGEGKKKGVKGEALSTTNGLPVSGGGYYYKNDDISEGMTVDCNVAVEPWCQVKDASVTIDGTTFNVGDYVSVEHLNKLQNKDSENANGKAIWDHLDDTGITIRNAVFAGGNVSSGSDQVNANTVTIYGNVVGSLRDCFNRDLITIGTEHVGGLYGDGNLTFVDGYRELHIDNYGTDYYGLSQNIGKEDYDKLSDREKSYFQLMYEAESSHTYTYYECTETHDYVDGATTTHYRKGQKITSEDYSALSLAEQAKWTPGSKSFAKDDQIEEEEWALMDPAEQDLWTLYGVCSIYAGRLLNTIQRADMVGVFGSRLVLEGAQDRVPEQVDYTMYTINRVGELSLNKRVSEAGDLDDDNSTLIHGNYFGIYNVVNYLGNLTSDVFFDDERTTNSDNPSNVVDGLSYHEWKALRADKSNRNNATSHNLVALASGVYLELKNEPLSASDPDQWGFVTGVVQLDLIDVMPGLGGGYVYAKNEHGKKTHHTDWGKVILSPHNTEARTYKKFTYSEASADIEDIETSGNFVHNTKQIVDDCYPNHNWYRDGYVKSPAHYWYIKGTIYVYDKYISAYTGSAQAYAESIEIPLTISAAAHGKMTLRDVQTNYYAYYDKNGRRLGDDGADESFLANNTTYTLNTPIDYWSYRLLSDEDKQKFVPETYTVIDSCKIGNTVYQKGYTMLQGEYNSLSNQTVLAYDAENDVFKAEEGKDFNFFVRMTNNLSHDTGYLLTYSISNPLVWDKYYTLTLDGSSKLNAKEYATAATPGNYTESPTYTPTASGVYGQRRYEEGEIIAKSVYDSYTTNCSPNLSTLSQADQDNQAEVERCYVVTAELEVNDKNGVKHILYPGSPIVESDYPAATWTTITNNNKVKLATVITSTLQLSATDYAYAGSLLTPAEIDDLKTRIKALHTDDWTGTPEQIDAKCDEFLEDYIADAYYCTEGGLYGGNYFVAGTAYRAIDTWCSMSESDRQNFKFNYDALDLLIDPTYDGRVFSEDVYGYKPQYDGYKHIAGDTFATDDLTQGALHDGWTPLNPRLYSKTTPIDYTAEYTSSTPLTYTDSNGNTVTINQSVSENDWLTREQYESIPNEKRHYSPIAISGEGTYYVVKSSFIRGDYPYSNGQVISEEVYNALSSDQKDKIDVISIGSSDLRPTGETDSQGNPLYEPLYYCCESYVVGENGEGHPVTDLGYATGTTQTYNVGATVPANIFITQPTYNGLPNFQHDFLIHGTHPTATSTLFVSRESDIYDLNTEKVITVIYLYEYQEADDSGENVSLMSERHIVNIHLQFKSGVPQIGELSKPGTVLPGTTVGLKIPTVEPGAFEITSSGWELFTNDNDATLHINGQPYYNNTTPMYWYQNNYWVAYYTQTYLGKTYSNSVQFSVANYHDLAKVMGDKDHHYYLDHKDAHVLRDPKIYINDYTTDDPATSQSGLLLLKDLFDLTQVTPTFVEGGEHDGERLPISGGKLDGHMPFVPYDHHDGEGVVEDNLKNCKNLEFFLSANQTVPSGSPAWTPIASAPGECFESILHGDGYYMSGLDNSLFGNLCGDVYNLGVMGTFTGAGIADEGSGFVQNCWIMNTDGTTATPQTMDAGVRPVIGNPTRGSGTQIVNCYYPSTNVYPAITANPTHPQGTAMQKPLKDFYNGEIAYDLNGFYLNKRYNDHRSASSPTPDYKYWDADHLDAQGKMTLKDGNYGDDTNYTRLYVEDRYTDGDFIYANGSIPTSNDVRLNGGDGGDNHYYPVWPDDYLFFGQTLTYGYAATRPHQAVPSHINKSDNRLQNSAESNRVYRAPAYYSNKLMDVAHFNPAAIFAMKSADGTRDAFPRLTALDFTGHNETTYQANRVKEGQYANVASGEGAWFPPLLDDDGLVSFLNQDLTSNLLVYIPQPTAIETDAATKTHTVVTNYLREPVFNDHLSVAEDDPTGDYKTVARNTTVTVRGHRIVKDAEGTGYTAPVDHYLVDKEDFNCPIQYSFGAAYRMWYQREPQTYVDMTKGWEGISIPFSAELVSTNKKGEITHFYNGSLNSYNDTNTKRGHEYWLREFKGNLQQAKDASNNSIANTYTADFLYPTTTAIDGFPADKANKAYTNTFLWDYYYSKDDRKDKNSDRYQQYYNTAHTFDNYAYSVPARPYIIGFPGRTYYEFDLSGLFIPRNTYTLVESSTLAAQVISFASPKAFTIKVSDDEISAAITANTYDDYAFTPNYLTHTLDPTAGTQNFFMLQADGSSYRKAAAVTTSVPFRPYFTTEVAANPVKGTNEILFSNISSTFGSDEQQPDSDDRLDGELKIKTKRGCIIVTSFMHEETTVNIVNAAGALIRTFDIAPGETIETQVPTGIYVVNKTKVPVK